MNFELLYSKIGSSVSVCELVDILQHICDVAEYDIKVTSNIISSLESNEMNVNAYYDPVEDEIDNRSIEVEILSGAYYIEITNGIDFLVNNFLDALDHEFIHQEQYRKRDFIFTPNYISKANDKRIKKVQEYLGNTDEIGAYALNIASEIFRTYGKESIDVLGNYSKLAFERTDDGYLISPNLFAYLNVFEHNDNVIKRLIKKIANYLEAELCG